jgi:predicted 3-demethylubiquinone-9 3-methyltransferase (glyoxalase superfamily)
MAITAGPHAEFNDAISLLVKCDTQAEIDKYWNAILEGGGKPSACGWINDRFGVRWQITFSGMGEMLANPDQAKAGRAAEAMLKQVKIDIAALQAAYNGG